MIHVFVGTDKYQQATFAERALESSIRENTPGDVTIHWMRSGEDGLEGWAGQPNWATPFSNFRWDVPRQAHELGIERAIYMDADMLALGDLGELVGSALDGVDALHAPQRWDVIAWNVERSVRKMPIARNKFWSCAQFQGQARKRLVHKRLSALWNVCDRTVPNTQVLHFTGLKTQPYHPYPHRFEYRPHADKWAVKAWEAYAQAECQGGQLPPLSLEPLESSSA